MKKLMIAAFAVAFAAVAQAATVNWNSGTLRAAATEDGGKGSSAIKNLIADSTTLDMYVYLVSANDYTELASMTQEGLYLKYNGLTADAIGSTAAGVANTVKAATTAEVGKSQYAVIIGTYTDKNLGDMYIATTASIEGTKIELADSTYDVAGVFTGTVANNWQPVTIPEPTSALMLLVGLAGLALKRKIA